MANRPSAVENTFLIQESQALDERGETPISLHESLVSPRL